MKRVLLASSVPVLVATLIACGSTASVDDEGMDSLSTTSTPRPAAILINEVLANEPGSNADGEFIELVNPGATDINVTGFTLSDAVSVRHTFASTVLRAGHALVVTGANASTGSLSLSNSGDTVTLRDASGASIDTVTYTSTLAAVDGVSFNRKPDGDPQATAYVLHTDLSTASSSPGKRADGTDFGSLPDAGSDAGQDAGDAGQDSGPGSTRIRLMAGNLTSGNLQSYDPGDGIRIFQGLKPDVAMIQEFNFGADDDAAIRTFVDTAFGPTFSVQRQTGVQIPNGVVSRFPILAGGTWDDVQVTNRDFVWARIDVPGPHDLWAISVHLLTSNASTRASEASALVALIRQNVPSTDFVAIGGDFNTGTRTEAALGTFGQVMNVNAPFPADQSGNQNTNASRAKPYDWVLVNSLLDAHRVPTVIGSVTLPDGLVFDSRVFTPLSAVAPVLAGDSNAANMQHMGVVKDFDLATP